MLEHKLNTHKSKFVAHREKALQLWQLTSQEPLSEFENSVKDNNVEQLTLRSSTLDLMQELVNRLSIVFDDVSGLCEDTQREVVSLWRRLETPEQQQDAVTKQTPVICAKVRYSMILFPIVQNWLHIL